MPKRRFSRQLPLRWRLTLWYLLTLGLILLLFAAFLYLELRSSLLSQLDASLEAVAAQAAQNVARDGQELRFQATGSREMEPVGDEYTLYLTDAAGAIWDVAGQVSAVPPLVGPETGAAMQTVQDDAWRVYVLPLNVEGVAGWVQAIADLDPISDTLGRLATLMLLGGPLALLLASLGGAFLARRALAPIDRMTRTAQAIGGGDLKQRIQYDGPADEVGRLAQTFDAMLDRLQTAFARERRFTGDAAHELRTPLTALKGRIGVTLSQPRSTDDYVTTLREMEEQVDRLARLSNDLLLMARLDQGRVLRDADRMDVADLLSAIVDQLRPLAEEKSITVTQALPDGLVLEGDMDLLVRLFLNLLDNAVKYTPTHGQVTITAAAVDGELRIAVTDSGPGIAPEHVPHLFERFYRVETARSREVGGAGLGLAIAYEITRVHGGQLSVESRLNQGASFIVSLPCAGISEK